METIKPKRRITLKLRKRKRPLETVKTPSEPPPKKKLVLKIKANGVEQKFSHHVDDQEMFSDSESEESDLEPVPSWTTNQSGGKSLRYASELDTEEEHRKRLRESDTQEEPEVSQSGRRKRKKRNMEGRMALEAYDWVLEITGIVGHMQRKKKVLDLIRTGLKGGFVSGMANMQKDGFMATISDSRKEFRAAGIFHIEHCGKSLSYCCLSIFATDPRFQKQGLGRMLTSYIIQRSLDHNLQIVVLARPEAVPFWTHPTLGFREMNTEEMRKYNRPQKTKKKKDDLVDLLYDGPTQDVISMGLLRFRPDESVLD